MISTGNFPSGVYTQRKAATVATGVPPTSTFDVTGVAQRLSRRKIEVAGIPVATHGVVSTGDSPSDF